MNPAIKIIHIKILSTTLSWEVFVGWTISLAISQIMIATTHINASMQHRKDNGT